MIDIINLLRIVSVILQLATVVILWKPTRRAFTSKVQKGDVLWALFWGDAINRWWFVARSAWFDRGGYSTLWEAEALALCYLFSIVIQVAVIRIYMWGRE